MSVFAWLVIIKKKKNKQYPGKQARNNIWQMHKQRVLSQHKTHSALLPQFVDSNQESDLELNRLG